MTLSPWYWVFLACSVSVFWFIPCRFRNGWLTVASLGWWSWYAPTLAVGLLAETVLVYAMAPRTRPDRRGHRIWFWGLIATVLLPLLFFKYLPAMTRTMGSTWLEQHLIVPLGISYFTFKFIHCLVETSRESFTRGSFSDFAAYIFLVPIFTAGPIERYDAFLKNRSERFEARDLFTGLQRIAVGLVKKGLLVTWLGTFILDEDGSALLGSRIPLAEVTLSMAWTHAFVMFMYIYLDFSAYSDIAIGASRLYGLRIMENFEFPILARNISDFWRRWHISLSRWCQSYIYMPILGLWRNPYLAAYASLLVFALWHAGTWMRVSWGLYQATGVAVHMIWTQFRRRRNWVSSKGIGGHAVELGERIFMLFWMVGGMAFVVAEMAEPGGGQLVIGMVVLGRMFGF